LALAIPGRAGFAVFKHNPPLAIVNHNLAPGLMLFEESLIAALSRRGSTVVSASNTTMRDKTSVRRISFSFAETGRSPLAPTSATHAC